MKNRSNVATDVSEFIAINPEFSNKYIFQNSHENNGLLDWPVVDQHALLLFDYLAMRKNATQWYKNGAIAYFDTLERNHLTSCPAEGYQDWFTNQLTSLHETLYSIPESGGSIPLIFRENCQHMEHNDIEMVNVASEKYVQVIHIE